MSNSDRGTGQEVRWPLGGEAQTNPAGGGTVLKPTLGRMVIYRSRTGDYDVPAIVTATQDTLNPKGVKLGHVPPLSSDEHVHLDVFTPGKPGMRRDATDFKIESPHGRSENRGGSYQEFDIEHFEPPEHFDSGAEAIKPGTWRWPV